MSNKLSKQDIQDAGIVEEDELKSEGLSGNPFSSNLIVASIVSSTKIIILSSGDFNEPRAAEWDVLKITSGSALGIYSIDIVLDDFTAKVKENIPDATSGDAEIYYQAGSEISGFNNKDLNWYLSKNTVQKAIEYVKEHAEGFPRSGIILLHNGTVGNNDWWTYNNLTPDRKIFFPVKSKLNELTWDANGNNVSFDLEFYKNGIDSGNLFWTHEVRGNTVGYEILPELSYTFDAGDWIRILYKDKGLNISDAVMVLWISRII